MLEVWLHHFGSGQGVTGVALLAESHISIHIWPEQDSAAINIFLFAEAARAEDALAVIVQRLGATVRIKREIRRGEAPRVRSC